MDVCELLGDDATAFDEIDKPVVTSQLRARNPGGDKYRKVAETPHELQNADMRIPPDLAFEAKKVGWAAVHHGKTTEIWRGLSVNDTNTVVALKCLRAQITPETQHEEQWKKFYQQVKIVRGIQHRNLIGLYGVCFDGSVTVCLVSPWMKNGDIMQYLSRNKDTDHDRTRLMLDVARGLAHLHAQDHPIVHGALQPSKVLVDDEGRAIVADFGLRKAIESFDQSNMNMDPMRYIAPELSEGKYEMPAADAYAWAMTTLHVFSGLQPFYLIEQTVRVVSAVDRGERPKREQYPSEMFTEQSWSLLEGCWKQDPLERLTMAEVVHRIQEMRRDLVHK